MHDSRSSGGARSFLNNLFHNKPCKWEYVNFLIYRLSCLPSWISNEKRSITLPTFGAFQIWLGRPVLIKLAPVIKKKKEEGGPALNYSGDVRRNERFYGTLLQKGRLLKSVKKGWFFNFVQVSQAQEKWSVIVTFSASNILQMDWMVSWMEKVIKQDD